MLKIITGSHVLNAYFQIIFWIVGFNACLVSIISFSSVKSNLRIFYFYRFLVDFAECEIRIVIGHWWSPTANLVIIFCA